MKNLNLPKKKTSTKDIKVSFRDSSKLLADFFHGVVIKLDDDYNYD